jgi:hypothetical protein
MKSILRISMSIVLMLSLFACSSSNDVVSNRLIQKRKYQKGFHLNGLAHKKSIKSELETSDVTELNEPESMYRIKNERIADHSEMVENKIGNADRMPNSSKIESREASTLSNLQLTKLAIQPKKLMKNLPSIADRWFDGIEPDNKSSNNSTGSISLLLSILAFVITFLGFLLGLFVPFVFLFGVLIGLTLAITAVVLGASSRKANALAKAGFILGWVYIVLTSVLILLTVLFIILIIAAFSA